MQVMQKAIQYAQCTVCTLLNIIKGKIPDTYIYTIDTYI